ncbi:MAG: helix-turn-helix domain-containing protein [Lachnospiraceae bacterium]
MKSNTLYRNRLIACREKLGITKQEAAKRMHLSQLAYLRYESGEHSPPFMSFKLWQMSLLHQLPTLPEKPIIQIRIAI